MERDETETQIVVDSNILISALINPDSFIWAIIKKKSIELLVPDFFLLELKKYSDLIKDKLNKKSNQEAFNLLISELFENILIIPEEIYFDALLYAFKIMQNIDENDSPFLALAIKFNCSI